MNSSIHDDSHQSENSFFNNNVNDSMNTSSIVSIIRQEQNNTMNSNYLNGFTEDSLNYSCDNSNFIILIFS